MRGSGGEEENVERIVIIRECDREKELRAIYQIYDVLG